MKIRAIQTRLFKEADSLEGFIFQHVKKLKEDSVLVVSAKIVSLSEGRFVIVKNEKEKERIIRSESERILVTKYALVTIKDGAFVASGGADESNGNGKLILLPKDSFAAAYRLRQGLLKHYKVKNLGVLLVDSRVLPLRVGSVGYCVGYAGFQGVKNYRGSADLFGRILKHTAANIADSLSAAAVLSMGEGAERKPIAIIENAPVKFRNKINRKELSVDLENDLYGDLFSMMKKLTK